MIFIYPEMPTIITVTRRIGDNEPFDKFWACTKCGHHGDIVNTFDCEYNAIQHAEIVHSDYTTKEADGSS